MTIDLVTQTITAPDGERLPFTLNEGRRTALLEGLDEIGMTLREADVIAQFESDGSVPIKGAAIASSRDTDAKVAASLKTSGQEPRHWIAKCLQVSDLRARL